MTFNQAKDFLAKLRLKIPFPAFVGSILSLGFAAALAALFFFAWLADEVFEGDTKAFDEAVRNFVHGFANKLLTTLMNLFTTLGSTAFLTAMSVGVFVIFFLKNWKHAAAFFAATMAGSIILNFALKLSFQRARPVPFFDTPLPDSYSFPSGHALLSVCFYGVLAWIITARIHSRSARILIWSLAVALVLLIGLSRIYLGVHYPSDVLAGYAAAFFWVSSVVLVDSTLEKKEETPLTDLKTNNKTLK